MTMQQFNFTDLWPELKCGLCKHHLKCQNNHQHDCGHPRKEEEEEVLQLVIDPLACYERRKNRIISKHTRLKRTLVSIGHHCKACGCFWSNILFFFFKCRFISTETINLRLIGTGRTGCSDWLWVLIMSSENSVMWGAMSQDSVHRQCHLKRKERRGGFETRSLCLRLRCHQHRQQQGITFSL